MKTLTDGGVPPTATDVEVGGFSPTSTLEDDEHDKDWQDNPEFSDVTADVVMEVVSRWTGIPVRRLGMTQRQRLLALPERLNDQVVGQQEAVQSVVEAVLRSRAGLGRRDQPVGSFLFLGCTGVGKTHLAKALAHELFDEGGDDDENDENDGSEESIDPDRDAGDTGAMASAFGKDSGMKTKGLVHVDMSEFMEAHTVSRLIGAPPG